MLMLRTIDFRPIALVLVALALLSLAGCKSSSSVYEKPVKPYYAVPETWCYKTLGKPDCYATPQNLKTGRLIGVQPDLNLPMSPKDHEKYVDPVITKPVNPTQ
jgi:hypothetical protein